MKHSVNPLASVIKAAVISSSLLLASTPVTAALAQPKSLQIDSGPLASALIALGAEHQMLLTFDPSLLEGKRTAGIAGNYSLESGLKALLTGQGLSYRVIDDKTVVVEKAQVETSRAPVQETSREQSLVVTATRTEQQVYQAPASISVISAEEIRQKPIADISDLLRQEVGIYVNQSQATGRRDIQIRGMDSKYTLLLIDGRRTSSAEALIRGNDFDLSTLPVESIERIEVIRGPMSALYGSDALGGVVNIITRKGSGEWQGGLKLSYETPFDGSGGDVNKQSLFGSGSVTDELALSFALERSDQAGWKGAKNDPASSLDESGLDLIEARDQINARLGLIYDLDEAQSLSADIAYSDDSRFTRYNSFGRESFTDQDSQRLSFDVGYQADFDDWSSDLRVSREAIDLSDETDRYAVKKSEQINHILSGTMTHHGELFETTFGAEYTGTEVTSDTDWVGKADVTQQALFLQSQVPLNDDFTLTMGGRVDDHEFFGTEFSPRAYLVYSPGNGLVVKGGYSEAFNAPDLFQLSNNYRVISCGGSCYLTGNDQLEAETAKSAELSVGYQADDWDVNLTYFNNKVDNLIERNFTDRFNVGLSLPVIYYQNVSKASFSGWELATSHNLGEQWKLRFNASTVNAINEDTNEELLDRPDKNINLMLDWYPSEHASYFARIRHIGALKTWNGRVPSYQVVDLGGQYKVTDDWTLKAGINNLADKRLDESDSGYEQVLLGRSAYLSMDYRF